MKHKKLLVALAAIVVVAMAAIGAYAYFTTTGSGAGTASAGADTPLTLVQSAAVSNLTPGGGAKSVPYTIDNTPASNGVQNLGVVSITGLTVDEPFASAGCLVAWFSTTPAASAIGTIAAGGTFTSGASTQPSIQLNNIASSQDACKNATLSFTLSAAAGS